MSCICTPYCPPPTGDTTLDSDVTAINVLIQSPQDRTQYLILATLRGQVNLVASGANIALGIDPGNSQTIVIASTLVSAASGVSGAWDPVIYAPGTYTSGRYLINKYTPTRFCQFPQGGVGCFFKCEIAPSLTYILTFYKNGISIGTVTWSSGLTIGVPSFAAAIYFDPLGNSGLGDELAIQCPVTADATMAGICIALKGIRVP